MNNQTWLIVIKQPRPQGFSLKKWVGDKVYSHLVSATCSILTRIFSNRHRKFSLLHYYQLMKKYTYDALSPQFTSIYHFWSHGRLDTSGNENVRPIHFSLNVINRMKFVNSMKKLDVITFWREIKSKISTLFDKNKIATNCLIIFEITQAAPRFCNKR